MRAIQITSYVRSPSALKVSTLPTATPAADEYLIAIHASGTNFFDLLQIQGKYQHQPALPWISGSEFAGVVLSTPSSTSSTSTSISTSQSPKEKEKAEEKESTPSPRFKVGDHVFGAAQGSYATHICAHASQLQPIPSGWTFKAAAGLMVTAPTSYAALTTRARVQSGDTVLIHAAAGGVGLAAVQIAKAIGAVVIGAVGASPRKKDVVRRYGADYVVDYTRAGWEEEVRRLTPGNRGVDVVFDPVGKVNASLRCTAWNGRVVVVGFAAGEIEKVAMNRVLLKNVSLVGLHWGMFAKEEPETVEVVWKGLFRLIEEGKIKGMAYEDTVFNGLERVGEALEMLAKRETWGKVVVSVPQEGTSKL